MFSPIVEVFNLDQCQEIVSNFDSSVIFPDDHGYSPNSFGIADLPAANYYVPFVTKLLLEYDQSLQSKRVIFKNSYTRKYLSNSHLRIHIDRPGLDYTISVCLESPDNFYWPLIVSNIEWTSGNWINDLESYNLWFNNHRKFNLVAGQGVFAQGRKYPHWRDTFPDIQDNSNWSREIRAVYVFYHWEII